MMMGSQMLDILRSGVWASLTGGWYHDPSHKIFTNTFHLYLWLSLFSLPLSFHLYFTTFNWYVWLIYASLIFIMFAVIKSVNQVLHHMFDTSEVLEEQVPGDEDFGELRGGTNLGPDTNQESIGLQDMTGARSSTPPVSSSSRNSLTDPARRGRRLERPGSTFDLKVDVHPVRRPGEGQVTSDTDVVIMVDESPGQRGHHEVTRERVLGESKQQSYYNRKGEVCEVSPDISSLTTSSQLTVSGQRRPGDDNRRFSNLSNLARSLPSDSSSMLEPITGSLDLAAILDPGYSQVIRHKDRATQVRRTKSALETGQTVSLDAGINTDVSKYKRNKSLEISESQAIREVEEVSSREGELDMEIKTSEQQFKGSDVNLSTYQEQLEEATKALLIAGRYLESETKNKKYLKPSTEQKGPTEETTETDPRGSGPYLPMVGRLEETKSDEEETDPRGSGPYLSMVGKVEDTKIQMEETDSIGSGPYLPMVGSVKDTKKELEEAGVGLLHYTVGLDWLFSDSEPEQPPGSPKLISQPLRSRSESPRSASASASACPPAKADPPREPRDSSHGSSGTDTETRALLNKLESVENILEQSGGAIPKRKPPSRRVRNGGHRSGSLDGGRRRREEDGRPGRRRRGLELDDDYQLPPSNTLGDDAAGLMLFLDILNGPDGQNKEAEAELKKLIERRRSRMQDDGRRKQLEDDVSNILGEGDSEQQSESSRLRKRRIVRRRRHNAQSHSEQLNEAESRAEGDVRKRDKRSRSQRDNVPHIATDHDDTSTGAVHCFKDEFGNWQTYTFGGESLASSSVGQNEGRALASLLSKESRLETPTSSRSNSADSSLTVILDSPAMVFQPNSEARAVVEQRENREGREQQQQQQQHWSRENSVLDYSRLYGQGQTGSVTGFRRNNPLQMFAESWLERTRQGMTDMAGNNPSTSLTSLTGQLNITSATGQFNLGSVVSGSQVPAIVTVPRVKKYHLLSLPIIRSGIKVFLDRVQLRNILDQDKNLGISVTAVLLSVLVSVLGSLVLQTGHYKDLCLVLFCCVQASCHYSLLKSVQPDASSPTHGDNSITVFSRPVYFIICSAIFLILDSAVQSHLTGFSLYSHSSWLSSSDLKICRDFVYAFILAFPLIFTIGLLPQVNTALMYLLETLDIHVFGGNASSSLQASVYCLVRSLLSVVIMFGFAYGGLTEGGQGSSHSAYAQQVLFSIFCSLSVVISYHLSRCSSDPTVVLSLMKRHAIAILCEDAVGVNGSSSNSGAQSPLEEPVVPQDPLPKKLRDTVNARLKNDAIVCSVAAIAVFLLLQSDVLHHLSPNLDIVLWSLAVSVGFLLHYLLPHLRKQTPWKCFAAPILPPFEQSLFEVRSAAKVMWWEKCLLWTSILERSVLYPLIFLSAVSHDREIILSLFGTWAGSLVMTVSLTKCLRCVWSDSSKQYFTLLLCILLFQYNPKAGTLNILVPASRTSPFVLDYFLTTVLVHKLLELYLKCQFVITYIAPHNINWGSAFHAFAQPFSVPHSAMLFLQAIISSILSSPLNPFLGSTIFILSYVRPVKFWERNYNTKRTDHSNTRLASQVEMRNPGADDNNLNSIFYEHLTRSLQHSLAGDLMLGRWGEVQQGDCFVLASDYLNCLVHIIELGNGLCTFQVRGLEFRGTYCQQREVEAIQEGVEDDEGCCCCDPGHLPHMLSINAAFKQRWLAWEVSAVKYVLEGYSISDNSAQSMLQVWDLRKVLISYYIKSIIYYTVRSPKLMEWLQNENIVAAVRSTCDKNFVDLDPIFNPNIDEDFDSRNSGITRNSYCNIYLGWIQHCCEARDRSIGNGKDSEVVSLCFALSLLGRRALGAQSNNSLSSVEFFLIGLHALFKGDFRITCTRDEWVFSDMELLRKVVAPAVRMSLKLHQDHFMSPEEYEENNVLYDAITSHEQNLVISHEGDPAWRHAVLSGAPSLLALRHVVDDGADDYKIIMLNKRHLSFRVIKLNRECVRGLWAGQQQELIFLRNRNPERGSIQNATQALRNIINSSCDQPIGYPIYVSPLTTSYTDSHPQVRGVVGGPLSLKMLKLNLLHCWLEVRERCIAACSSSSSADCEHGGGEMTETAGPGTRCSVVSSASVSKPSSGTLASLAGLLSSHSASLEQGQLGRRTRTVSGDASPLPGLTRAAATATTAKRAPIGRIIDSEKVYDNMNLGRRIDPYWPDPEWRAKGGRNAWSSWIPLENMEGPIVHRWVPCHRDPFNRSHTDKTILLLKIGDRYVPIAEHAVLILPEEDKISHKSSREEASQSEAEEVWTRVQEED